MSRVSQIKSQLETFSLPELREIHNLLDDLIEDKFEFTPDFKGAIECSEKEMQEDKLRAGTSADVTFSGIAK